MKNNYYLLPLCLFGIPICGYSQQNTENNKKPNVLFICVDDLRRELGVYGSVVKTPNIDRLASEGSLFFQHYVQVPTSGASRASMLTGLYPKDKSDLSNEACRTNLSNKPEGEAPETLFHQLKRNGYYTVGIGKISHYADGYLYGYTDPKGSALELPYSWDEMLFDAGKWGNGWNAFFGYSDGSNRQSKKKLVKPYECADVSDEGFPDGLTANLAVKKLNELAGKNQPFCLSVGFLKPHLPFTAPKKYWDLYEEASIPVSPVADIPDGCNLVSLHESGEFNGYLLGEEKASLEKRVSDEYARKIRHAYFACISYMDTQVGKVLDALEVSGEADNTIVVLWGDHGWHLGDLRVWGKHTLHETSLSSALIIKAPGHKRGVQNKRIVSSIDIYPTLMELCQVPTPKNLDGHSLVSLLDKPSDASWEETAYSYFNNGVSLRTPGYRFTRYNQKQNIITELYEYKTDLFERKNIAEDPAKADVIKHLLPMWEKGIRFSQ